jgi:hypothetical protein
MNIEFLLEGPEKGLHVSEFWSRSQILEAIKLLKLESPDKLSRLKYFPRPLVTSSPTKKSSIRHQLSYINSQINPIDYKHSHPTSSSTSQLMRMPIKPLNKKLTPISYERSLCTRRVSRVSKLDTLIQQCSDLKLHPVNLPRSHSTFAKLNSNRVSLPRKGSYPRVIM